MTCRRERRVDRSLRDAAADRRRGIGRALPSRPDPLGGLDERLELAPLDVLDDEVPVVDRGEAALWREREPVDACARPSPP
jgi:hypothetical protein